ncbi:MAG: SUMF1/EgtB/PvdO family nonheme iron enzyme [Tissierellales bacterium]|nr:SUMF1/EgtB/PvdO family nonheme iron enzyme [Tissierellales bacterium]
MVKILSSGSRITIKNLNYDSIERPVVNFPFNYDYWIDTVEVTQNQFNAVMQATYDTYEEPDWESEPSLPAYGVNWYDAVLYCNAISKRDGFDTSYTYSAMLGTPGIGCVLENCVSFELGGYRLPNEAEWEYACRAGTNSNYYWGNKDIDDYAWYYRNSSSKCQKVGQKIPNSFGLYDMIGNVMEWCNDVLFGKYESEFRALRGGSCDFFI